MKKLILLPAALASSAAAIYAGDTKFEGTATCAKCDLKVAEKCRAAVIITVDGKKETYLTEPNDKAKQLHSEICGRAKPVKVEGTLSEKDGQKVITLTRFFVD